MNRRRLLQNAAALLLAPSVAKLAPPAIAAPIVAQPAREAIAPMIVRLRADTSAFDAAMVATGGICAPVSPYYGLVELSADRPIRDALPRLAAPSGGVRYETPEPLS